MATKKYLVNGKIIKDDASKKVLIGNRIVKLIGSAGAPPTPPTGGQLWMSWF